VYGKDNTKKFNMLVNTSVRQVPYLRGGGGGFVKVQCVALPAGVSSCTRIVPVLQYFSVYTNATCLNEPIRLHIYSLSFKHVWLKRMQNIVGYFYLQFV
jgi:hypothetical protein